MDVMEDTRQEARRNSL